MKTVSDVEDREEDVIQQCNVIAPANEYFPTATQCERQKGHDGSHVVILSNSSRRIWEDVSFKINFIGDKK